MLSSYLGSGRDNIRLKSYKKEDAKKKRKKKKRERERENKHLKPIIELVLKRKTWPHIYDA